MISEAKETGALWLAGVLGAVVALPYHTEMKTKRQRFTFLFTGIATSYYLGPVVAAHFAIAQPVAAFLCGLLAGSVIAKAVNLIASVRVGDFLTGFLGGPR
ncbi:hypothetical protein [Asaia astilbis]|uniref:hypothetical protein n=1 Tax=Asaia astilbis TaxID=610244 RepID=UPI00046F0823|nr:hypothetical protein [Asaia astilbis]